ncbi:MAG: hypothetical protein VB876_02690 [Pirellulales bacterium]
MAATSKKTRIATYFGLGFFALQIVLVTFALATTSRRMRTIDSRIELPPMRNVPLEIRPLYDRPRVVTNEQLTAVLHKLRPRLRGENPKINHVDHALRFWGLAATFDDPECLSGMEMRELLTNYKRFSDAWGKDERALITATENGLSVRTQEGFATASHVDHTLAGLAETGTPLEYRLVTPQGPLTVRALLESSLRKFSLNQIEYEWSTLAYALYLPPTKRWYSKEGQEITFDRLADRIMRQRLNMGVCMGNHRLHALVVLLRVDDTHDILSANARERVIAHLQDVTTRFVRSQHPDGYWIRSWPDGQKAEDDEEGNTLPNRILGTGHVLEWWALAPEELLPPRETIVRAGQWLTQTIVQMDDASIKDSYTYLSHAGRALALWRGHFPSYFLRSGEKRQQR